MPLKLPNPPGTFGKDWMNQYTRTLEQNDQQIWSRIQNIDIIIDQNDVLNLKEFGAVADGVIFSDDTTNVATATNNSAAIRAAIVASVSQKKKLVIPAGNFMFKTPIQVNDANDLRMEFETGAQLLWVNPTNVSGITLGSTVNGVNKVGGANSTLSLAEPSTSASTVIKVASSVMGAIPTALLSAGMDIYIYDTTQPVKARTVPYNPAVLNSICYYQGTFAKVRSVVDNEHVELFGITEWSFAAGSKIGYWNAPNNNVVIENAVFVQDPVNSFNGGGASSLSLIACQDFRLYNTTGIRATSRLLQWRFGYGANIDTLIGIDTVGPSVGSLCTGVGVGASNVRNIWVEGSVHGVDFGGGPDAPSLHNRVTGIFARGCNGGIIGSHQGCGYLDLEDVQCWGDVPWNLDQDPDVVEVDGGGVITLRGPYTTLSNFSVTNAATGILSYKTEGIVIRDGRTYNCGRGIVSDDTTNIRIENVTHQNPLWWGTDVSAVTGPTQNQTLADNIILDNVNVIGTPGTQGDVKMSGSGQYNLEERCFEGGWQFTRLGRNGRPALVAGFGTMTSFPFFVTGPGEAVPSETGGGGYPLTAGIGASDATVASTASVTSSYVGGELLPILGGTVPAGSFSTVVRVDTVTVQSVDIDSGGSGIRVGAIITADGGTPITPFTYRVDTIDGSGTALTGTLLTGGEYRTAPQTFSQFSIIDAAQSITNITQANPGVVTYTGIDFSNGDRVFITAVGGMIQVNNLFFKVANVNTGAKTFELQTVLGVNVNTTGYIAYTSGGTVALVPPATITVTSISIFKAGSRYTVGDTLEGVGGNAVTDPSTGLRLWPQMTVTAISGGGATGPISAVTLTDGGTFNSLPPSLGLSARGGTGTGAVFLIVTFVDQKMTFNNAVLVPSAVSPFRSGRYTVAPTNPVSHGPGTGTGAGATFNLTTPVVLDVSLSPKPPVLADTGVTDIASLGSGRGLLRMTQLRSERNLRYSARLLTPGGIDYAGSSGDILLWQSDGAPNPVYRCIGVLPVSGVRPNLNLLVNPSFNEWTLGTTFAIPAGIDTTTTDRWIARVPVVGRTVSQQAGFGGAYYSMRVQRDAGVVTLNSLNMWYSIPTTVVAQLAGRPVTFSFYADTGANYSSITGIQLGLHTGTAGGQVPNRADPAATAFAIGGALTQSNNIVTPGAAFRRVRRSFTVPANALDFAIRLSTGSFVGTAGAADYFETANLKLEVGLNMTPVEPPGPL